MVPERHELRLGGHLLRGDGIARERGPAADDLVTRIEQRLGEAVDDAVRTRARRNLLETNAVPLGEGHA